MVIMYHTNRFLWHLIGRWLVRPKFFTLVNLLADRRLVPEFMPYFTSIEPILQAVDDYLKDKDLITRTSNELIDMVQPMSRMKAGDAVVVVDLHVDPPVAIFGQPGDRRCAIRIVVQLGLEVHGLGEGVESAGRRGHVDIVFGGRHRVAGALACAAGVAVLETIQEEAERLNHFVGNLLRGSWRLPQRGDQYFLYSRL